MRKKNKINRNNTFYSESDFNFDIEVGLEYISNDINQTVLVYQIDREQSNIIDIYGETTDDESVSYKEPVEINVIYFIDQSKNKAYDKNKNVARYSQIGNLRFGVYEKTLKDNDIDIRYGDYIGIQVTTDQIEYFVVTNDGRVNFDNKHTMFGTRSFYRTIEATPTDKNEFNGR